jgi:putative FMN-dependent luciferase-like monooxygenase
MNAQTKRLGFFTRILDEASPPERYRLATEQIAHAEKHGFDAAWVAQHHFHEYEGGLPSPFVFLAHAAARTSRIRLGTGIVTLPMENPLRVAEDAAVLDAMSGGRLELGMGSGGTPSAFSAFGLESAERGAIFDRNLAIVRNALSGGRLGVDDALYPAAPTLLERIWQASFSVGGAIRAGKAGDGLLLSRTQPRPKDAPRASLAELQLPMIDAYMAALPAGRPPRILGSRTLFVADSRVEALRFADIGLRRIVDHFVAAGHVVSGNSLEDLITAFDVHVGTVDDVIESLSADATLARVTDVSFQVHSIDPPHAFILRSIELIADKVAPALGWRRPDAARPARLARAG